MRVFLFGTVIVSSVFGAIVFLNDGYDAGLRDALVFNGWVLAACMATQLAMRVKVRYADRVPGSLPIWTRMHIAIGFLTVLVFGVHVNWSVPDTLFEWSLWTLFVLVAASGMIGAWLNRAIPFRLEQQGERIPLDRIPARQERIAARAESLALGSIEQTGTITIANLFADQLHDFFAGPRNIFAHLSGSHRPLKQLRFQLQCVERDVPDAGATVLQELQSLVEGKNRLDVQYAHETALKAWLFVHLPATYGLVALSIAHVVVVYAFTSGSR